MAISASSSSSWQRPTMPFYADSLTTATEHVLNMLPRVGPAAFSSRRLEFDSAVLVGALDGYTNYKTEVRCLPFCTSALVRQTLCMSRTLTFTLKRSSRARRESEPAMR